MSPSYSILEIECLRTVVWPYMHIISNFNIFCNMLQYRTLFLGLLALCLAYLLHANNNAAMSTSTETLAQKNRKYWDVAAEDCHRDQWVNDLQKQITAFLIDPEASTWLGLPTNGEPQDKMLDYACGDGLPSRTLKPHFRTCIGVDISAGMLAKYNATATRLGLGPEEMIGVRGDLFAEPVEPTDPPLPEERLQNFDLVAICMALHHMEDIQLAISKLAARLRPGGTLLVIDWAQINGATEAQREFMQDVKTGKIPTKGVQQNGHMNGHGHGHSHHHEQQTPQHKYVDPEQPWKPHPASHTITHDSFTEDTISNLFHNSGCAEVRWKLADRLSDVPGARTGKMQLFWARATKQ